MPYNNIVPQINDKLSISQEDFLNNFEAIDSYIDINHYTFGDPNEGKHKYIDLRLLSEQEEQSLPSTENEVLIYILRNLIFKFESKNNLVKTIGLSNLDKISPGYAFIGRSLIKWGLTSVIPAGPAGIHNVFFPAANLIPNFSSAPLVFSIPLSVGFNLTSIRRGDSNINGFSILKTVTDSPRQMAFLAIGPS